MGGIELFESGSGRGKAWSARWSGLSAPAALLIELGIWLRREMQSQLSPFNSFVYRSRNSAA